VPTLALVVFPTEPALVPDGQFQINLMVAPSLG